MSHDHDPQNIDYRATLNVTRVHNALARENPDRLAESRPVSLWVSLGAIAVAVTGATYFGGNVGVGAADGKIGYNKFGANYHSALPEAIVPETAGGGDDPMKAGEKVYKNLCQACHQPNGLGVPGTYPPIDGSEWVIGGTERLALIVGYGASGPMTVKGASYGAALMPPHGPPKLTAKEFAAVLTYIRGAWSNTASAVSIEEATDFFNRTKGRTAPYTEPELKQIPEDQMLGGAAPAAEAAPAGDTPPAPAAETPAAPPPAN